MDRTKARHPRFSPDSRHIAHASWQNLVPEIHLAAVGGGLTTRLTHWGSADSPGVRRESEGHALSVTSHGQPFSHFHLGQGPRERRPRRPAALGPGRRHPGRRRACLLERYRHGAMGRP
ncbi:hypothetical protein ACFYYD_22840 [Streptomyces bluensis]|uniref:hypothetical protein n=1 Tax=Streptomyces bluensis TaxID=33897 RepID=UPI003692C8A6